MKPKVFGNALKNRRIELGLTQSEVALRLGFTSAQFVSNWERSLCNPPLKRVDLIARIYKIPKLKLIHMIFESKKHSVLCQTKD